MGNNIEFYIKQLEAENEKLRASLEAEIFYKDIEEKRNIFTYEKWETDNGGTLHNHETTLDKNECRKWIDYMTTDMIGSDTRVVSFLCYAYKKDKNFMTCQVVWDAEFEAAPPKKQSALAVYKLKRGRAYRAGGDYRQLKATSIRTKKYGE